MRKSLLGVVFLMMLIPVLVWAQTGIIEGRITDRATGDGIVGANVVVEGTELGAATSNEGTFTISNVPVGKAKLFVSVIGFRKVTREVSVTAGKTIKVDVQLESETLELGALEVLASRATRSTPVAYTNVEKLDMELKLGSRDIPMALTTTPSVYATEQGGGAGDARVNVRGFNQRNVSIMINGVPVNDMENGWVYWSNWDGVADATSSIQMQRGLSAVNLAAPSIGGTMNILTDPTKMKRGGMVKQEFGSGDFLKTTVNYNSGLIADKFAINGTVVRKTGEGVIDGTWTDAWAYYFGLSYAVNKSNRLELFALGAPQRHGQMRYAQNIAAYSHDLAKDTFDKSVLDADADSNGTADVFDKFPEVGREYNENWNKISSDYKGKQHFYMYGDETVDRQYSDFMNEVENYFHKPQVNLNWYLTLNEKTRLSSIFYFSGGSGGGSGTFGDLLKVPYGVGTEYPSQIMDWDATIATNEGILNSKGKAKPAGESVGFLRNSVNQQRTIGAISKLNYDFSQEMKVQLGIDWRTASVDHFREVRDLLGGDYAINGQYDKYASDIKKRYKKFYNEFDSVYVNNVFDLDATLAKATRKLAGKIYYNNTNTIDWLGVFTQGEYKKNLFSLYAMGGFSMIKYSLIDHFKKAANHQASYVEATDNGELKIVSDWISAIQFKAGGLYKLSEDMNVFANFGYVEKVPILDNVIDDVDIALAPDPTNEKFISTELGWNGSALADKLAIKINAYNTMWKDRNVVKAVTSGAGSSGDTDLIFLTGMNQTHRGFELEVAYQPVSLVRFDGAVSIGKFQYTDDAEGTYKDVQADTTAKYTYAIKDLMVGDSPQSIYSFTTTVYPIHGLTVQATVNYYDRYWAEWDPTSRIIGTNGVADREQSWQVPSYSNIDAHISYNIPVSFVGVHFQVFCHIFNLMDALYIQDAIDNSLYNAYGTKAHQADDAEVFVNAPRRINFGLNMTF